MFQKRGSFPWLWRQGGGVEVEKRGRKQCSNPGSRVLGGESISVVGRKGPLLWKALNACEENYHLLDCSSLQLLVM